METSIAILSCLGIAVYLVLKYLFTFAQPFALIPLYLTLAVGGVPLFWKIARRLAEHDFGADVLAGISIVTSVLLGEYLVGSIVVLMLSGGTALEQAATRRASSVLDALARRAPQIAHRKRNGSVSEIPVNVVVVGDDLVVFPHEICPVDGVVLEGDGIMDESYLTGEPFQIAKMPGSQVLSGAINGEAALIIRAQKPAIDSRYAQIMKVVQRTETARPRLRRIGDRLGAWYAPLALVFALIAWLISGSALRFLSVLVIATPCPLILAIPVAIIGAISVSAKRSIIIKDPTVLEQVSDCHTFIFDKTGTLTYGKPQLTEIFCEKGFQEKEILSLAASLERYSKHPLAGAILDAAAREGLQLRDVKQVEERPGRGLRGVIDERTIWITGRNRIADQNIQLPPIESGLECLAFIDDRLAATIHFQDAPRKESKPFVTHLGPKHQVDKVILLSGDRGPEVRYLASRVGIGELYFGKTPEEKVEIVKRETALQKTFYLGDGINDAPALMAATVGVAFGKSSDVTAEAADAVILEPSLGKVDELIHIGKRLRTIALQSAIGGMSLSGLGMVLAMTGHLPPLAGVIAQEAIDLAAVLNALRVARPIKHLTDF